MVRIAVEPFVDIAGAGLFQVVRFGERRIGKTSLLYHLADAKVADSLGLTPDKFCLVYVDFQGLTDITPHRFWQRAICAHLLHQAKHIPVGRLIRPLHRGVRGVWDAAIGRPGRGSRP